MNALRTRVGDDRGDSGVSIVEVIVAMMMFAMIATGAMYTMLTVLRTTHESRAGQVAANLAAEEIDLSRDVKDLFTLVGNESAPRIVELNGDRFTIVRHAEWVSEKGDLQCGTGGGPLRYKRINVEVTWDGMRDPGKPVRSDTVIDPSDRVNDPALGTILVSVNDGAGEGTPLVQVTAVPDPTNPNGARTPTSTPATDSQGCSYILKVVPGNYDVTVTKTDYVDGSQNSTPTADVTVEAGAASSAKFQFDEKSTLQLSFLANYPGAVKLPTNLDATFISSFSTETLPVPTDRRVSVHPFSLGYQIVPGAYAAKTDKSKGCLSPDPLSWPKVKKGNTIRSAARQPAVAAAPGGTAVAPVAMGVVRIDSGGLLSLLEGSYVKAVSTKATGKTGDPGCATPMTYTFGSILPLGGGQTYIALPYGSWKLYAGSQAKQINLLGGAGNPIIGGSTLTVASGYPIAVSKDLIVTLDPRQAIVPAKAGDPYSCVEDAAGTVSGGECDDQDADND